MVKLSSASTQIPVPTQAPDGVDTNLDGRWLVITRGVWIVIAALALGLYVATIPAYISFLHILCTDTLFTCWNKGQITSNNLQELHRWGLSLDFFNEQSVR